MIYVEKRKKMFIWLLVSVLLCGGSNLLTWSETELIAMAAAKNSADVSNVNMSFSTEIWNHNIQSWTHTTSGGVETSTSPELQAFIQTSDGGYLSSSEVAGVYTDVVTHIENAKSVPGSNAYRSLLIQKINRNGSVVWSTVIGEDGYTSGIFERSDGKYVSLHSGSKNYTVLDSNTGNLVEEKYISGLSIQVSGYVTERAENSFICAGSSKLSHFDEYGSLIKSFSIKTVGGVEVKGIFSTMLDDDGNYVVAGYCASDEKINNFRYWRLFIAKYNDAGTLIGYAIDNSKVTANNVAGFGRAVCTPDGGYMVAVRMEYSDISRTGSNLVVKFTNNLQCSFMKILPAKNNDGAKDTFIKQLNDNKYLICSRTNYVIDGNGKIYNQFLSYRGSDHGYDDRCYNDLYDIFDNGNNQIVCGFSDHIVCISKGTLSSNPSVSGVIDVEPNFECDVNEETYIDPEEPAESGSIVPKLFKDYTYDTPVREDSIRLYANGGTVTKDGIKKNYKSYTLYTKVLPSYIYITNTKGKLTMANGKVIAGITSTNAIPVLTKGKIVDAAAAKIAKASIKNGQVTVTAQSMPGTVYLWVMDTGDLSKSKDITEAKETYTRCPVTVRSAPSAVYTYATDNITYGTTKKYTSKTMTVGSSTLVYVYPGYKEGTQMKKAEDATYTATIPDSVKDYISVTKAGKEKFKIRATGLKNGKNVIGKVTITCNQNGKKAVFTVTVKK